MYQYQSRSLAFFIDFVLLPSFIILSAVLCGNRVSQMTRAYDDIDAVTRLLEEKEKDLELTVQIGKELLTQNTSLENRVAELEQELKSTNENLAQLAHELHQKNELIGILTNDTDDSSENGKYGFDVFHRDQSGQDRMEKSYDISLFFYGQV